MMAMLKLLATMFWAMLFAVVLLVKLVSRVTGAYDSMEHLLLDVLLLALGSAALVSNVLL